MNQIEGGAKPNDQGDSQPQDGKKAEKKMTLEERAL